MTITEAIVLGVVQAVTEFLPISSSGHLVLIQHFLGLQEPMVAFDVLLHVGSLIAVIAFFRRDLWTMARGLVLPAQAADGRRLVGRIVLATVPAVLIGFGYKDFLEGLFDSPVAVGFFWIITAGMLFAAERMKEGHKEATSISRNESLLIGLFQAIAILPGVSRSGSTLAAGVFCGLHPKEAARFSFLIYVPAIIGATMLQLKDMTTVSRSEIGAYAAGGITSAVLSYAAIWFLIRLLQRRIIAPFAWYCLGASAVTLFLLAVAG